MFAPGRLAVRWPLRGRLRLCSASLCSVWCEDMQNWCTDFYLTETIWLFTVWGVKVVCCLTRIDFWISTYFFKRLFRKSNRELFSLTYHVLVCFNRSHAKKNWSILCRFCIHELAASFNYSRIIKVTARNSTLTLINYTISPKLPTKNCITAEKGNKSQLQFALSLR